MNENGGGWLGRLSANYAATMDEKRIGIFIRIVSIDLREKEKKNDKYYCCINSGLTADSASSCGCFTN